jgi:DNA-directed RNA polymerase sigma subunit (sigma70/sigma32)
MSDCEAIPDLLAIYYREMRVRPLPDRIREGNLGLVRAVDRFDPERGNRLSTYAYYGIKRAIERAIEVHQRSVLHPIGSLGRTSRADPGATRQAKSV